MKTIDLCGLAGNGINNICSFAAIAEYYKEEFQWLLNHAQHQAPDAKALYIGSYIILLQPDSFYNGTRFGTNNETMNFILNESMRLISEAKEVDALFRIARVTCEESRYRRLAIPHLLGFKLETDIPILDKDVVKALEFQRANQKTLVKMKEACVRALLREIQPPFTFNDDMDLSDNKRTYKSIFD